MADPKIPPSALLVVAAFSRHQDALAWARERLSRDYGAIARCGEPFLFNHTSYYEKPMGRDLWKQLWSFEQLVPEEQLATIKLHTNEIESELAKSDSFLDERPLNLDPGLLTLGKFVLATTKDQAHRIYLRHGIYAEVTLRFQDGAYEPWPWTYADYREVSVRATLKEFRDYYRKCVAEVTA
jgi:hypothetical protein